MHHGHMPVPTPITIRGTTRAAMSAVTTGLTVVRVAGLTDSVSAFIAGDSGVVSASTLIKPGS